MINYIPRLLSAPSKSFFLFGPRGTGKSTWLLKQFPHALLINLLNPETFRNYQARPERLLELCEAAKEKIIIIDEIQKIPELLNVIHQLIESQKNKKFILTGSSARKIKRAGVDLLAGRAIEKHLHPFMAAELGKSFNLNNTLQLGLIPLVIANNEPKEVLKTYISLYLKEEVQAESLVRNIGHFARFLEVMSFSHGSILNLNNIARKCEVSRKLVENYLSILEDLLLSFSVSVFSKRAKRKLVSRPKFYYFDSGVFYNLRAKGPLDQSTEIAGLSLEGLVAQHLRAWIDYQSATHELYYWRTRSGVEVDFIVYGEKGFWAIEVKNSTQIFAKDLRGLKNLSQDYPEATLLFLYRGKEKLKKDNIYCIPVEDFLISLNPQQIITV